MIGPHLSPINVLVRVISYFSPNVLKHDFLYHQSSCLPVRTTTAVYETRRHGSSNKDVPVYCFSFSSTFAAFTGQRKCNTSICNFLAAPQGYSPGLHFQGVDAAYGRRGAPLFSEFPHIHTCEGALYLTQ